MNLELELIKDKEENWTYYTFHITDIENNKSF